jgi:cell division protein ZapA
MEFIPTNLVIGDRTYRVRILPKDEEVVRRTIKTVNDKLIEFKTMFAGKDMQDYIAMVLIWLATEQQKPDTTNAVITEEVSARLQALERMVDSMLEENAQLKSDSKQ